MRNEGYEAVGFSSGREALKHLGEFDPDVVIAPWATRGGHYLAPAR